LDSFKLAASQECMCGSNWVCARLGLKDAIVEDTSLGKHTLSPKKTGDRHSVDYIVN
jgi:hypothetical protein